MSDQSKCGLELNEASGVLGKLGALPWRPAVCREPGLLSNSCRLTCSPKRLFLAQ